MFEKNRSRMIVFIMLLSVFVLSDESDCKFSVGGKNYDLTGLKTKTATGDDSKISTYHYTAAVCSDMSAQCEDIMTVKNWWVLSTKWVENLDNRRCVGTCLQSGTVLTQVPSIKVLELMERTVLT